MNRTTLARHAFLATRVWHRFRRIAADTPPARLSAELNFAAEREAYRPLLPGRSDDDGLLAALRTEGVAVTTADQVRLDDAVAAAAPLVEELLSISAPPGQPVIHLAADRLATAPEIFQWGGSDRVLDLLERYFEVPVAYHGVVLRRDVAGEQRSASNQWHLDAEDRRVIKVIVYLTEVVDGDGAFQHLPLRLSMELRPSFPLSYRLGPDERVRRLVGQDHWKTVNGPAGTVLISDTGLLFHKGQRPARKDRVALFYDYTTRRPLHPFFCKSGLPRHHLERLTEGMGSRAKEAVFWRPKLTEFDPTKHTT